MLALLRQGSCCILNIFTKSRDHLRMNRRLYMAGVILIFLLSFRFFSARYYPALNSDNAITVLMLHDFHWPDDIYFWRQDRMGSLIPLLGYPLHRITGLSALVTESIVHYAILLLGFLAFASFIRSRTLRLLFALFWFFPPMRLIDVTQFSFGIHYSLVAIGCYLFNLSVHTASVFRRHLFLASTSLVFIAAIWVSDMAMVTVALVLSIQTWFYLRRHRLRPQTLLQPEVLHAIVGMLAGYAFIHYAKQSASVHADYALFGSWEHIQSNVSVFFSSIGDFFLFRAHEPLTSIYAYLVAAVMVALLIRIRHIRMDASSRKWMLIFLADALVLLAIILASEWTFDAGVPRRYFTCTYVSLGVACILMLDHVELKNKILKKTGTILPFLATATGGAGTLYNLRYVFPGTLQPRAELSMEFEQPGRIGIIADFWNSYVTSCVNPDKIIATPHDQAGVRNYAMAEEVFRQDSIYVIRDMWMDAFPDTLVQFSHVLVQDGQPFRLGDCYVRKYKVE